MQESTAKSTIGFEAFNARDCTFRRSRGALHLFPAKVKMKTDYTTSPEFLVIDGQIDS